jgi:hypothetical protein
MGVRISERLGQPLKGRLIGVDRLELLIELLARR